MNNYPIATILGGGGFIGRYLVRNLTNKHYRCIIPTRNAFQKGYLKTQAPPGSIELIDFNAKNFDKIEEAISNSDVVINLIGILFERGKINTFEKIHTLFPKFLSEICKKKNKHFIHISSLGVENASDSKYAASKAKGENKIFENLPSATILKPSIVYSVNDSFTTRFMSLLNFFPIFPLYYGGKTKFAPIHASDLTDIIFHVIENNIRGKKIEPVGPKVLTFLEILNILSKCINKKRVFLPLPLFLAKFSAKILEKMPNPLLTVDQLNLLKYDNISSENNMNNFDLGSPSKINFEEGVMKYAYNWREGGQFSVKNFKKG